MSYAVSC